MVVGGTVVVVVGGAVDVGAAVDAGATSFTAAAACFSGCCSAGDPQALTHTTSPSPPQASPHLTQRLAMA
jgi:hypothetical protein